MRQALPAMLTAVLLLLSGCSSVPEKVREAPEGAPSLLQVRQNPEVYKGAQVRWGGTIAQVQNLQDKTRIEIVARELYGDGEPRTHDLSEGRFIAVFNTFLDPAIYAVDRSLTVVGTVTGIEEGKLGEMTYRYPVVTVEAHYLWPRPVPCENCDPMFYDPWYPWYPYYPWRRYPYYY